MMYMRARFKVAALSPDNAMHEFSFCDIIVKTAVEEFQKAEAGGKLKTVRVAIGRLHQVVFDSMVFAYEVLAKDTPAEGSVLEIRELPVTVKCSACGWSGVIQPPLFACGQCGQGRVEVTGGKELYLEALEIEYE